MLIKFTNRCSLGCSHCMERSVPSGPHMTLETFAAALAFTKDIESMASVIGYRFVLLSGGECTENPEIVRMIEMVYEHDLLPTLISNGMWLNDERLKEAILGGFPKLLVQVTNDPRFYPRSPPRVDHPNLLYIDSLTGMMPIGRFAGKTHTEVPSKRFPTSFNFRSVTRSYGDARAALEFLRGRTITGKAGHCSPSISHDGSFVAGETNLCFKVGDVWTPVETITANVIAMGSCNQCTLEDNLSAAEKGAIGCCERVLNG